MKRFEVLHQSPVTPAPTLREEKKEETNMRRSKSKGSLTAKWVNQRQEAAIKIFRLVLFVILQGIRMQMVKAAEAISIH